MTSVRENNTTIKVPAGGSYTVIGDDDNIFADDDSAVIARGSTTYVDLFGTGDFVTIGGNGEYASDAQDNFVTFHAAGTLNEYADSRVGVTASGTKLTLAGDDTLGVYGEGDTVVAKGFGDGIWIGLNGADAASAARDVVTGLAYGTLFEMQGSAVTVFGSHYTATMNGDDALTATGSYVTVLASGAGNLLGIGGSDDVVHMSNGAINVAAGAKVQIVGDDLVVHLAVSASLSLVGSGDRLVVSAAEHSLTVGQNGNSSAAVDTVTYAYTYYSPPITVLESSNVQLIGYGAQIVLDGDDQVYAFGSDNFISEIAGGNTVIVGGNGRLQRTYVDNLEIGAGDTVRLLSNSWVGLFDASTLSAGQDQVFLKADDSIIASTDVGGFTFHVPVASGDDSIAFGASDRLILSAHFASVDDLLAHTTSNASGSVIQFDAQDSLTLNIDTATLATYAREGFIKFS